MTPKPSDLTLEQAVCHWTRRKSGSWTAEDERQLVEWLAAAPGNRAAYEKVAAVWATAGEVRGRASDVPLTRRRFTARNIATAGAIVLISALGLGGWLSVSRWWNGVPVHWVAPRGESRTVDLEDGTRVLLDADSELVTKIGGHARRVSLVRGEALFTVTHDASRPFVVEIGPGSVVDLGTRFDVERRPHCVRVAVFEGRVGMRTQHGEMVLSGGRGGGYDDAGGLLPVKTVDAAAMLRADGERHFESEPLSAVVAKLARYHPVSVVFDDPQLQDLRVSGTFRMTDLALFFRTLTAALPIGARWTGPQRVELISRNRAPGEGSRQVEGSSVR